MEHRPSTTAPRALVTQALIDVTRRMHAASLRFLGVLARVELEAEALADALARVATALRVELPATEIDLGEALRSAAERRPVIERRRATLPCDVCGSVVMEVLRTQTIGDVYGRCAGCGYFTTAAQDAEVLP